MEKNIKLTMGTDKAITIFRNEKEVHIINNRTISAEKIYEILNFSKNDRFTVFIENKENIDIPVLQFFHELFNEITDKINGLSEKKEADDIDFVDDIPF